MQRINVRQLEQIDSEENGFSTKYWVKDDVNKLVKYNDTLTDDADVIEQISAIILRAVGIDAVKVELGYDPDEAFIEEKKLNSNKCCLVDSFLTRPGDNLEFVSKHFTKIQTTDIQKNISSCFYKMNDYFSNLENITEEDARELKVNYIRQVLGDCIIGNEDRNLDNVGIIHNEKDLSYRLAPSFDNGVAFHVYGKGEEPYCYVGGQSFPATAIVEYILKNYFEYVEDIIQNLDALVSFALEKIKEIYSEELSEEKLNYINEYLIRINSFIKKQLQINDLKEKSV